MARQRSALLQVNKVAADTFPTTQWARVLPKEIVVVICNYVDPWHLAGFSVSRAAYWHWHHCSNCKLVPPSARGTPAFCPVFKALL